MTTYQAPTTAEKLRALPWSFGAQACNSVFAQLVFFGPAFVLFLAELGISRSEIGFLLSLIPFTGLVALFIAPQVARFGYKRTFLTFWGTRKIITSLLLVVPFVAFNFGIQATILLITVIMIGFSLCRSIAETGYYPWVREFVPDSVRGKYSATNSALSNLTGIVATAVATFVIGLSTDINRFVLLFAIGVVVGLIGVMMYSRIPGGAPVQVDEESGEGQIRYRDLLQTIKDSNLRYYLVGILLFTFGTGPLYSFLPLFMEDVVQLSDSNVLSLQIAVLVGGLISSQLLGWSADRYGSKPVMISGIVLTFLLPIGFILMPRATNASLFVALALSFLRGIAQIGWQVGSSRLLFTQVVPEDQKSQYMAVYYAGIGLIGGVSQFIGGAVLDATSGLSGQLLFISLDSFTVLMVIGIVLPALSLLLFRWVRADSNIGAIEFAGLFTHGNPVFALGTMVRFYRAKDETQAVKLTEALGQTNSPLTAEEMMDALSDPRFYVRFEAVVSISRMDSNPQLTQALIDILQGTELSLSSIAAWALGRIGDPAAIPALREGLESDHRSIRTHCARALGVMGDHQSIPILHEYLKQETEIGSQVAYASALANLGATPAIPTLLDMLHDIGNDKARMDITLSLAKMVSDENHFVSLVRGLHSDPATTFSGELLRLRVRLNKNPIVNETHVKACRRALEAFGNEDMTGGIEHLISVVEGMLFLVENLTAQKLLQGSLDGMTRWGFEHPEYILLALNILNEDALFATGTRE